MTIIMYRNNFHSSKFILRA